MRSKSIYHKYTNCKFCGKEYTVQNLSRHMAKCIENPKVVAEYKAEKYICENCGKEYSKWDRDNKRFCSSKCSRSYSQKFVQGKMKEANCIICGTPVTVPIQVSKTFVKCVECRTKKAKEKKEKLKKVKVAKEKRASHSCCNFCGRETTIQNINSHERACKENPNKVHMKHARKRSDIREGYIYKTTNLLNGKIYIGKRAGMPSQSKAYFGSGIALNQAIKKYGSENFKKDILEIIENGDLNERERFWILKFNSFMGIGYNMTEGGDGGPLFKGKHHTEETKLKLKRCAIQSVGRWLVS